MTNIDLKKSIDYLFNCNYFSDDFNPEGNEEHQNFAEKLLENYTWEQVYAVALKFITKN